MNGAPYQFCEGCKHESNFKWKDGFTLECLSCGYTYRPSVKEPIEFSSMRIESGKNQHLSMSQSEELFNRLIDTVQKPTEVKMDNPFDVRGGVLTELPMQGRDVTHTPIDVQVPSDFAPSINLRIFMKRIGDDL